MEIQNLSQQKNDSKMAKTNEKHSFYSTIKCKSLDEFETIEHFSK